MTPAPMFVPCTHTQSPDSQRRAPMRTLPAEPFANLVPRVLFYSSLRSDSTGRRENLGTSLSLSLAQFWRTPFVLFTQ